MIPIGSEKGVIEHAQKNVIFESKGVHFHISGYFGVERTIEYILRDQIFCC